MTDSVTCSSSMHTAYRSVLFVTEETHCPICCPFSGCVSAAAAANPTVPDATEINQTVRTLKSQYIDARFWRIEDPQRIVGMPDARYRNNSDSLVRGRVSFSLPKTGSGRHGHKGDYQINTRGSVATRLLLQCK